MPLYSTLMSGFASMNSATSVLFSSYCRGMVVRLVLNGDLTLRGDVPGGGRPGGQAGRAGGFEQLAPVEPAASRETKGVDDGDRTSGFLLQKH